jgi:hypothetical protein
MRNGRRINLSVSGDIVYTSRDKSTFSIYLFAFAQRTCTIDGRQYEVTVLDGNANLSLGDTTVMTPQPSDPIDPLTFQSGDIVVIGNTPVKGAYGQPLFLKEKWYRIVLSEDGSKVDVQPLDLSTGQIRINLPLWSGIFVGSDGATFQVFGTSDSVVLPPDRYTLAVFQLAQPDIPSPWQSSTYRNMDRKIEVTHAQQVEIPVFTTLLGKIDVTEIDGDQLAFSLSFTDIHQNVVDLPAELAGIPLVFEVRDKTGRVLTIGEFKVTAINAETGEKVDETNLPTGQGRDCIKIRRIDSKATWRPTLDFQGDLYIRLLNNADKSPLCMEVAHYEVK